MTQTKHTPGPWGIIEGKTLLHVETRHDNPTGAGVAICSVPKSAEANARLIAAAPEMLNALKHALNGIECYRDHPMMATEMLFRAAIANAEGRS